MEEAPTTETAIIEGITKLRIGEMFARISIEVTFSPEGLATSEAGIWLHELLCSSVCCRSVADGDRDAWFFVWNVRA